MSEHDTISTSGDGLRAAAARDGRTEASDATTRIIVAHTPVPWFLTDVGLEIRTGAGYCGKRIAYVSVVDSLEVARANARLLVAAPELLAACKAALGAFEHNHCIDWNDLVRAIDKAEGRA